MSNDIITPQTVEKQEILPEDYNNWRKKIILLIEQSKLKAIFSVNAELLALYWKIGKDILTKQKEQGWGAKVIVQLSKDLTERFPDDRGFSERNLRNMKKFASEYPAFPIWQVPLAELEQLPIRKAALAKLPCDENGYVQVSLTQISWYHHMSLIAKVPTDAERAFYIMETAANGWSRDVMLSQVANGYIIAKGNAITNFKDTLPAYQSDLAQYAFKDPYNFSFLGTVTLQHELDIEKTLAKKITDFLLEMGKGFAFIGRQYHLSVDGDDYYIDILMYHLQLHCYVVVELKAVEFVPEFVSKLNFYISAVDEYVKAPEDKPTIGLLLCRSKSDTKARFALRGITQPLGIAQYETEKLFEDVASALPQIEDIENHLNDKNISTNYGL
ncbi:MAG: PDDEXK nuclease domain-containing protein [Bacteroidales bacterium]|nr:PDDEXK nuclease domain-containing protein [Bacteroidales bacterium]